MRGWDANVDARREEQFMRKMSDSHSFTRPGRFFPPPFRVDGRLAYVEEDQSGADSPGPSNWLERSNDAHRPKRQRLQFTSELAPPVTRLNPDGTENVEWARYQSALRLKSKWDSIYEKFKDAHLLPQDEIFLGSQRHGEMRVLRDRGILRGLKKEINFGHFIKLEEAAEQEERLLDGTFEPVESDEDELGGWGDKSYLKTQYREFDNIVEEQESQEEDPDLRDFLEAERRRREVMGEESEVELEGDAEEDDESVIDFTDPHWDAPKRERLRMARHRAREGPHEDQEDAEKGTYSDGDTLDTQRSSSEFDSEAANRLTWADSNDEMDLFNDDPDISAYDAEAIADLIREQNAQLALEGKMLVPEEEVDEFAYLLTGGGPSQQAGSFSPTPSGTTTLASAELTGSRRGTHPQATSTAFETPSKPFQMPMLLPNGNSARPTPTPSQHSDFSSTSTKVGSDPGFIIAQKPWIASSPGLASERFKRSSSRAGSDSGDASDATVTPTRPLRKSTLLKLQQEQADKPFSDPKAATPKASIPVSFASRKSTAIRSSPRACLEDQSKMLPPRQTGPPLRRKARSLAPLRSRAPRTARQTSSSHSDEEDEEESRIRWLGRNNRHLSSTLSEADDDEKGEDAACFTAPAIEGAPSCGGPGACSKTFCMSCGSSRSTLSSLLLL
ncbi:hypothetical protein K437DRAFT_272871 [Tilletiaria anomala UBC 951]|uniref:Uncharacterized protein n=1 Tax=Tilletiaria anomala (strain ATCC 24038 / CBS 436.72 / UBC 951) TaxID=1037660 RepID=A0A066WDL3_TILAU|nr:uncharacterized protein K437DRAFT_272871 [Tilletiaria anomala UBC 951]KDN52032.1 hypothetical protein K437DRAFT_272871 [Tilletiaria anomala UBC 951]